MKKLISICICLLLFVSVFATPALAYIPFEGEYALGDVDNSEGKVTATDALMTLQNAVGKIKLDYEQRSAADVDGNFTITAADALKVLQKAVGKIELEKEPNVYDTYELNYVEPTGLEENTIYLIASSILKDKATGKDYDMTRLAVCIQGLINRNNDQHKVAVALRMDGTDDFWLDFMQEDGAYYSEFEVVNVNTFDAFFETFLPFMEECGIIVWDPNAPSTANIASTICGLDSYLPVQYSTEEGSVYQILTETYEIPVKMNLCDLEFTNAKLGGTIADTDLKSTGSVKNDPYIWAIDKYMDRCNPEMLAYTLDGASSVEGNPVQTAGEGYAAGITGIPNHDYFIMHQMFFFDHSTFAGEPAPDDPTQPLGSDVDTMQKILQKRYDMAGGMMGIVQGFPPWHVKYTNFKNIGGTQEPTRIEWAFVEVCGTYNCGIEADAANPCWMSNGSLYAKYEMRYEPVANAEPDETIEYDPETYYWTQGYAGDFDCSPWLKMRTPQVWGDPELANVPMTFNYSVSLINRVPMAFDYIYSKKGENNYLTAGEGTAYTNSSALFKGFVGKEFNSEYSWASGYRGTENYYFERTLPDGDLAYYQYIKPYIDFQKLNISGMIINGFTPASAKDFELLSAYCPAGGMLQNSTAPADLVNYNGVPFIRMGGIGGDTNEMRAQTLRTSVKNADSKFYVAGFFNIGTNAGTPTEFKKFLADFEEYLSWKETKVKIQFVDIETFFKLLAESGRGDIVE